MPGWKFSNEINWIPGTAGKGIILRDGEVETWTIGADQEPNHDQYCYQHGVPWNDVVAAFDIEHDGGIWSFLKDEIGPQARVMVQEADPRLNAEVESDTWNFSGSRKLAAGRMNWEEGNEGKGIIDHHRNVHTWNTDDYEVHDEFLGAHPDIQPTHYFGIDPSGEVTDSGLSAYPLRGNEYDLLREEDPRLYGEPGMTWKF